jgi:hypothetical protein
MASNDRSKLWRLSGEWSESGTNLANRGDVNIDLVAEHGVEKVLVEFKYLKTASDQRLIKDMVKLALPKNANYARLLLVAHSPTYQDQGKSKSTLLRAITSAGRPVAFNLTNRDFLTEVKSDLNIIHSLSGKEGEHVARIMSYDPSVAVFVVELVANCSKARENALVFSISRM